MAEQVDPGRKKWVSPYNIGQAYAAFGDAPHALDWFEKGMNDPDSDFLALKLEAQVDPIRQDHRFQKLLQRLKLQ